jgi:neutral ceramidase
MRTLFRVFRVILLLLLVLIVGFVIVIGPWPVYRDSNFEEAGYFARGLEEVRATAQGEVDLVPPGRLKVGWSVVEMTPKVGVPLGGYGARKGEKRSTGVHDPLFTRAVAFNDGKDTIILVTADMLIVPPNIADLVRAEVKDRTGLPADAIIFNASHTHCGPGGLGPGLAMSFSAGPYDPEVPVFIAERMSRACVQAYESMEPARILLGAADGKVFIRNRAVGRTPGREDVVDSNLDYCLVRQEDNDEAVLVRFSAHPTIYGSDMMEFSAEFPGAIVRHLESTRAGLTAIYVGGAVGSMSPRTPDAPTDDERIDLMGSALAGLVAAQLPQAPNAISPKARQVEESEWISTADVASIGFNMDTPSFQMRPIETMPKIRISPLARAIAGVPSEGWVGAGRVGNWIIWGTPYDCSGEMSVRWREWGEEQNLNVWTLSFNAAYLGYLSPDEYYWLEPLGYETALMSWTGPDSAAMMTAYLQHAVEVLTKP